MLPARQLHAAVMQHARSAAGQQKHIIIGDAAVFHGIGMQTRVAVIDAVDIRINAAEIGVQEGRQRDRRRIGTAAAERRNIPGGVHALKARCQHDAPGPQLPLDAVAAQAQHPGAAVAAVRLQAHLPAAQAHGRDAEARQRQRAQADGDLLARGQQAVRLPSGAVRVDLPPAREQGIRCARLRREHGDDLVPGAVGRGDAPRRAVQPPCVADGRAAELINDTSQENSSFPAAFYAAATRAATK